jgi:uncharacterized Fe-S radical SAM superfamily protein PflX
MDGLVDIYMPDFKLRDEEASRRYLAAVSYPRVAPARTPCTNGATA